MCEAEIDEKRILGIITNVWSGVEDHGILTCSIQVDFSRGGVQSFGNLCLTEETMADFIKSLCKTFGVNDIKELTGKQCYVLKCFSHFNEPIEGLEALDGERFTISSWRKRVFPDFKSAYEERIDSIKRRIDSNLNSVRNSVAELASLEKDYTDWG